MHAPHPELGLQQVPGEAIWRLQNARKPFSGLGSALDPLGELTALPLSRSLQIPTPALGPLALAPRKWEAWPVPNMTG